MGFPRRWWRYEVPMSQYREPLGLEPCRHCGLLRIVSHLYWTWLLTSLWYVLATDFFLYSLSASECGLLATPPYP